MNFSLTDWLPALLASTILLLSYRYLTKNFDYWQKRKVIHTKPLPLIGNFWEVITMKLTIGHYLEKVYKHFDAPIIGMWAFMTPGLIVKDPELVKNILVKDFQHFSDRTLASDEHADKMASNFLFLLKNPAWKEIRTKLTPVFTSGKLKAMFYLMNNSANDLVDYIDKHCVSKQSNDAKEVAAKYTTDVLTSTAFGLNANSFKYENAQFRVLGRKMFDYDFLRGLRSVCYFFSPYLVSLLKLQFFTKEIYSFMRKTFWMTIEERELSGKKRNDLIDAIIEIKKGMTNDQVKFEGDRVVAQAGQFFAAGFETTSSAVAFTLYELALNTELQDKLRAEIKAVIKNPEDINYETIHSMKYLQRVVSETLRKYPALPFLDRRCIKDYHVPNSDLVIEKDTPVYIPMLALHYDAKYFPNPHKYDPERFNEENSSKIQPYTYIPFGEGPHNCIGARFGLIVTKIGLIRILNDYEVAKSDDTPVPLKFDARSFLLQSINGIPLQFRKHVPKAA